MGFSAGRSVVPEVTWNLAFSNGFTYLNFDYCEQCSWHSGKTGNHSILECYNLFSGVELSMRSFFVISVSGMGFSAGGSVVPEGTWNLAFYNGFTYLNFDYCEQCSWHSGKTGNHSILECYNLFSGVELSMRSFFVISGSGMGFSAVGSVVPEVSWNLAFSNGFTYLNFDYCEQCSWHSGKTGNHSILECYNLFSGIELSMRSFFVIFVSGMGFSAGGSVVPEVTWNLAFSNGFTYLNFDYCEQCCWHSVKTGNHPIMECYNLFSGVEVSMRSFFVISVSGMGFSAGGSVVPEVTWNLAFSNGFTYLNFDYCEQCSWHSGKTRNHSIMECYNLFSGVELSMRSFFVISVSAMGFSAGGSVVPEVTWNLAFSNGFRYLNFDYCEQCSWHSGKTGNHSILECYKPFCGVELSMRSFFVISVSGMSFSAGGSVLPEVTWNLAFSNGFTYLNFDYCEQCSWHSGKTGNHSILECYNLFSGVELSMRSFFVISVSGMGFSAGRSVVPEVTWNLAFSNGFTYLNFDYCQQCSWNSGKTGNHSILECYNLFSGGELSLRSFFVISVSGMGFSAGGSVVPEVTWNLAFSNGFTYLNFDYCAQCSWHLGKTGNHSILECYNLFSGVELRMRSFFVISVSGMGFSAGGWVVPEVTWNLAFSNGFTYLNFDYCEQCSWHSGKTRNHSIMECYNLFSGVELSMRSFFVISVSAVGFSAGGSVVPEVTWNLAFSNGFRYLNFDYSEQCSWHSGKTGNHSILECYKLFSGVELSMRSFFVISVSGMSFSAGGSVLPEVTWNLAFSNGFTYLNFDYCEQCSWHSGKTGNHSILECYNLFSGVELSMRWFFLFLWVGWVSLLVDLWSPR